MSFFTFKDDTTGKFADSEAVRRFEAAVLAFLEDTLDLGKLAEAHKAALGTTGGGTFERKGTAAEKIIQETVQKILGGFPPKNAKP
ncbi:MAG: hypothetical protein K0R48_621 [Gammaproteobacteria bacterium]|nr:hypothetical protein [Gammaproteobacteria bacterium]